jgi:hypothetical protein
MAKIKLSELKELIKQNYALENIQSLQEKKEDEEVDVDVETSKDSEEIDVDVEIPETNTEEDRILQNLIRAQREAESLGDEKLLTQIGNTITYFTREHIVKAEDNADL